MNNLRKSLGILFPAMRISLALVLLTTCILLSAEMLGVTPNEDKFLLDARSKMAESLAIQFSVRYRDATTAPPMTNSPGTPTGTGSN